MGPGLVAPRQLVGVAQGVAEVEQHPRPGVPLVPLHNSPFNITAGIQNVFDLLHQRSPGGPGGQEVEEGGVFDAAVLHHLRHAVGKDGVGQGVQGLRVHKHQPGLPEGPGQVLAVGQVHGHLPSHGGVHLGQQGGGDLDKVHPPEHRGGGEARQVPHHAAPQGGHRVGAGEAKGHHLLPQLGQPGGALGLLPGGEDQGLRPEAGGGQAGPHPVQVQGGHMVVGDQEDPLRMGQSGPEERPGPGKQAPVNQNVIAPARQGHGEGFHRQVLSWVG